MPGTDPPAISTPPGRSARPDVHPPEEVADTAHRNRIPGFILQEKIGTGGMATVYKARQLSLDRTVAIKILSRQATHHARFVERFYAEGRAAAKLNHPNIVAALDVGQAGDCHYFVMEYVQGQTVYDLLQEEVRFEEIDALPIMLAIAKALAHAHDNGLIHRDIKPQNMIVEADGTPKLLDLGLARQVGEKVDDGTRSNEIIGSPYYMSPEQIRKNPDIDFRTDIYSFGCTFYLLVTGHVPFEGPTVPEILKGHLKGQLIPPRRRNPRLSVGADRIIRVCLARDRQLRYQSTRDLVQDLEALALYEDPIHAAVLAGGFDEQEPKPAPPTEAPASSHSRRRQVPTQPLELDRFLLLLGWSLAGAFFVLWLVTLVRYR